MLRRIRVPDPVLVPPEKQPDPAPAVVGGDRPPTDRRSTRARGPRQAVLEAMRLSGRQAGDLIAAHLRRSAARVRQAVAALGRATAAAALLGIRGSFGRLRTAILVPLGDALRELTATTRPSAWQRRKLAEQRRAQAEAEWLEQNREMLEKQFGHLAPAELREAILRANATLTHLANTLARQEKEEERRRALAAWPSFWKDGRAKRGRDVSDEDPGPVLPGRPGPS